MPTLKTGKKKNTKDSSKWKTERRKERQKAYHTKEWSELSKQIRMEHPICQECGKELSVCVHHIKSPFEYGLSDDEKKDRLLSRDNLLALCAGCHIRIHEQIRIEKRLKKERKEEKKRDERLFIIE